VGGELARIGRFTDDRGDLTTASAITRDRVDCHKSVAHGAAERCTRCGVRRRGQGTMNSAGWTQERSCQMTATPWEASLRPHRRTAWCGHGASASWLNKVLGPAGPVKAQMTDCAMTRKPRHMVRTSQSVCVTRISTLRSGMHGNGHAPFLSSGRRRNLRIDGKRQQDKPAQKLHQFLLSGLPHSGMAFSSSLPFRRWEMKPTFTNLLQHDPFLVRPQLLTRLSPP
jgi:hypothetical protein